MYLTIILLPLLGAVISGIFGRKVGVTGAHIITCTSVVFTTLLAILCFIEVGINNVSVHVKIFRWLDSESLNVSWGFVFDCLTVSMLIPVLIVSSLVHIYSIGYMSDDPWGRVRGIPVYGDKLSNSGDLLKLLIPNKIRKYFSRWINNSEFFSYSLNYLFFSFFLLKKEGRRGQGRGEGKPDRSNNYNKKQVISQKMTLCLLKLIRRAKLGIFYLTLTRGVKKVERKMDYRGSKSIVWKGMVVKEQWVDGSWSVKHSLTDLRYTLKGFERNRGMNLGFNTQQGWNPYVKIPSKQFDLKKYSTFSSVKPALWSGLIDGEGSFSIIVDKNKTYSLGWRTQFKFQIALHIKDINILYLLQQYLGGIGSIHLAKNRDMVNYSIDCIKHLNKLIIHLDKYPLFTQKFAEFLLFKQAVNIVNNKAHLTVEGLNKIINIKASMNLGLSDSLKSEFFGYTPVERAVINYDNVNLDPYWIAGFVSAEGNFDVRLPSTNSKLGYRVQLRFRITQHIKDIILMEKIIKYFSAGKLYKYGGKNAVSLSLVDFTDITNIIIPFFNENSIIGIKLYDYLDWCKIHSLMINRLHLTVEGINSIRKIKSGMNRGRDF